MYQVEYRTKLKGKKHFIRTACFSGMQPVEQKNNKDRVVGYESILYKCPIDEILSLEDVKKYLEFLKEILPIPFQFHISKNMVFFKIKPPEVNREKVLLVLSAFRYLDEHPNIVLETAKLDMDLEKKFEEFQLIHFNFNKGTIKNTAHNKPPILGGHGLVHNYSWGGKEKIQPITFKKYQENLKSNLGTVQAYFR